MTDRRTALLAQIALDGGKLRDAPDGPILETFDASKMAQALEHEINRSAAQGFQKISIHMDLNDAARFAAFMRRAALLGA